MPKEPSSVSAKPAHRASTSAAAATSPTGGLKRNQACHQCRRRKLIRNGKCSAVASSSRPNQNATNSDAQRPICSTCIRSHKYLKDHPPPDLAIPAEPECTFDEPKTALPGSKTDAPPRRRYEKLEKRITELESMLNEKESEASTSPETHVSPRTPETNGSLEQALKNVEDNAPWSRLWPSNLMPPVTSEDEPACDGSVSVSAWPKNLPSPEIMRHLVEVFFSTFPHASKVIHQPSFMHSLSLHPTHHDFPKASILHAIAACGGLFSAAVTSPSSCPPTLFWQRNNPQKRERDSFTDQHFKYSRFATLDDLAHGENLFPTYQTSLLLAFYSYVNGRFVEVWNYDGNNLRFAVPFGLSNSGLFESTHQTIDKKCLLTTPETAQEAETRINAFWVGYCMSRFHWARNGWATCLTDEDITQYMPIPGAFHNLGMNHYIQRDRRQHMHTKDLLITHPTEQTDAFTLYVKAHILISKIHSFHLRVRLRSNPATDGFDPRYDYRPGNDIRMCPAFGELDQLTQSFLLSFPRHLRDYMSNGTFDSHLASAIALAEFAIFLLHDPLHEPDNLECPSRRRLLVSARASLRMVYELEMSSYDLRRLDIPCAVSWAMAARTLVRILQAGNYDPSEAETLKAEIEVIRTAIEKGGQIFSVLQHSYQMLTNFIHTCTGSQDGTLTWTKPFDVNLDLRDTTHFTEAEMQILSSGLLVNQDNMVQSW